MIKRIALAAILLLFAQPLRAADTFTYVGIPTITNVSPNVGPVAGGTSVTITGTNFFAGASAAFGTNPATNVVVVSQTQLTATSPPGTAGTVNVTVTSSGGTSIPPN